MTGNGKPEQMALFASGLEGPFGIAFYPPGPNPEWVYVGNLDSVVRFPYQNGDLQARGPAQHIADLPGGGGHTTRNIQFSLDGKKLFASVGSASNVDDTDTTPAEKNRADVLEFNPDGSGMRVFAYGFGTVWDSPSTRRQASCGVRPTNAMDWETIWFRTTSRMCRKAASMAGHFGIWADIRIRGTRASILN